MSYRIMYIVTAVMAMVLSFFCFSCAGVLVFCHLCHSCLCLSETLINHQIMLHLLAAAGFQSSA